jgi:hypothetical protein
MNRRSKDYCAGRWVLPLHDVENRYGLVKRTYWRGEMVTVESARRPNLLRRVAVWALTGIFWQDWHEYEPES